jgi:5-formyltetrahydrofolate cyclo-ligase
MIQEVQLINPASSIHERLFASAEYRAARNISIYLSMPNSEVSTGPIVKDALKQGKKVFVPFIYKNACTNPVSLMDMVALHSESDYDQLEPDKWGIPTPDEASIERRARCLCKSFRLGNRAGVIANEEAQLEQLDLVVTPGVAFDRERRRLGHGKGYYDIFFAKYEERIKSLGSEEAEMPYLGSSTLLGAEPSIFSNLEAVGIALDEQILSVGEEVPTNASDRTLDAIISGSMSFP